MNDTETDQIASIQLALASAKCPKCEGVGYNDSSDPAVKYLGAEEEKCPACSGSGFLLQGVRDG